MTNETSFIWYELMSSDTEAAKAFYGSVVGWTSEAFGSGNGYSILKADGRGIGGLMEIPAEARQAGARPAWLGYVAVPDVDAAAQEAIRDGATLHKGVMDIPGAGRIAMLSDPQGAPFYLIQPSGEDQPAVPPMTPGHIGWHELHARDWEAAFDFYSRQFGWAKDQAMDMGSTGTYQLFTAGSGNAIGAMFNGNLAGRSAWLFYFTVSDIDVATDRVREGGGEVLQGPMEVPGGAWIIEAKDPQGAMFALVGSCGKGKGENE